MENLRWHYLKGFDTDKPLKSNQNLHLIFCLRETIQAPVNILFLFIPPAKKQLFISLVS